MPSVQCGFHTRQGRLGRDLTVEFGPTVHVQIGFDLNYRIGVGQRPALPTHTYPALIDTGAFECCIDSALARLLRLPIVDREDRSGVDGKQKFNIHLAQICIPELDLTIFGRFAGVHLFAGGQPHSALIGRTLLQYCSMTYEGTTGIVTLSTDSLK